MADKLISVQALRKVVGELTQGDGYDQGRVETFFRALDGIPAVIDTDRLQELSDTLQAYLDTGYTPEQVRDMAFLYRKMPGGGKAPERVEGADGAGHSDSTSGKQHVLCMPYMWQYAEHTAETWFLP